MSLEAGGRASKIGNTYERLWAVRCALLVIDGKYRSLHWEPIGDDGNGIDLWIRGNDGRRIGHQLKRQHRSDAAWSVANLREEGILQYAREQLDREPSAVYVFVSSLPVPYLTDFVEQVHRANNDSLVFYRDIACASRPTKKAFHELLLAWELDPDIQHDILTGFELLRRMQFVVQDKSRLARENVEFEAGLMFSGEPANIVAALGDFLDANLGNDLFADRLREALRQRGFYPRILAGDSSLPGAIALLQNRFDSAIGETLIAAAPIQRPEVKELAECISDAAAPKLVFVHGQAGCGKSVVVHQLFKKLQESGVPCLPIQLHSHRPEGLPDSFGRLKLGLPASPALSLRALAGSRHAVLILDQLDALRLTSSHSYSAWESCAALIDQGLADPHTTVVLACRTFDLENDPKIATWKRARDQSTQFVVVEKKIAYLPEVAVTDLLSRQGVKYSELPTRQQTLLRTPSVLALWWNLAAAGHLPSTFHNATQLMRQILDLHRSEIHREHAIAVEAVDQALSDIVTFMDIEGRLDMPGALVRSPLVISALCSAGLLHRENARITFVHQGYFDYLVADRVLSQTLLSGIEPIDWVKANQSLFRRDQLRQLLNLLRDSDHLQHDALLRHLLLDPDVRFHLKHLALGHLGQCDPPLDHELRLAAELAEDKEWWPHVQGTILWSNLPWFDALYESGYLASWLATWTDDEPVRLLLRLFRPISEKRSDAIDNLLTPIWNIQEPCTRRIAELFGFDPTCDTPAMAEFRLERIQAGDWPFEEVYLDRLAEYQPRRVVPFLDAALDSWLSRLRQYRQAPDTELPRFPIRDDGLDEKILDAVRTDADRAWNSFSPLLRLLSTWRRLEYRGHHSIEDLSRQNWQLSHAIDYARDLIESLTIAAVEGLARKDAEGLVLMLSRLPSPKVRGMERAIAKGLLATPETHADFVLSWLVDRAARFRLGDGHDEIYWEPARALIQRFSPHCSGVVIDRLEAVILKYHDPWEHNSYKRQLDQLRKNQLFRNEWGRAQNVLLAALPLSKISERARSVATTWRAKFGDPCDEKPMSAYSVGGWVTSPIPPDRLMFVSNRDWLKIIRGQWPEGEARPWRRHGPDVVGEASVRHFGDALGNATKRDPKRFADLALKLPRDSDPTYFTSILHALSDAQARTEVGAQELEAIVGHVGDCADAEYVQSVCRLVKSRDDVHWSDAIVQRIIGFAAHPEPAVGTFTVHRRTGSKNDVMPDVAGTAINCVRGCVASAIHHLLWARADAFDRLVVAARRLLNDAHPAVRHESLGMCLPIMKRDKDLAIRLAIMACEQEDDRVLESRWLNNIFHYARTTHLEQIEPLILRMVRSTNSKVAESGAAWATACWIDDGRFAEVVRQCRAGTKAQRLGVIEASSDYFARDRAVTNVAPILKDMFNDDDLDVRSRAARVFRYKESFGKSETVDLAKEFVASRAFLDDPLQLLRWLSDYPGNIALYTAAILNAADRVTAVLADQTRDMRQRVAFAGNETSTLLLRLYEHSYGTRDQTVQTQCLDRWDEMLRGRVGMTAEHLKQLDD